MFFLKILPVVGSELKMIQYHKKKYFVLCIIKCIVLTKLTNSFILHQASVYNDTDHLHDNNIDIIVTTRPRMVPLIHQDVSTSISITNFQLEKVSLN